MRLGCSLLITKRKIATLPTSAAQCHTLHAPFMQTSDKHEKIMASPKNHFGDDASIDDETNEKILEFPRQNLAQKSNSKWEIQFAKNDDIAII